MCSRSKRKVEDLTRRPRGHWGQRLLVWTHEFYTAFEMWWHMRRNQISSFGENYESI